jgi:hypothetical protein
LLAVKVRRRAPAGRRERTIEVDARKSSVALGVLMSLGAVGLASLSAQAAQTAKSPLGIKVVGRGQTDITGTLVTKT